jgi:glutathione S-transferase
MERQLEKTAFLVGASLTLADLALYAYTHEAGRAGFDMSQFPAIGEWLERIQAEPDHVDMAWLPS